MNYTIEKGIPLPLRHTTGVKGRHAKYPFKDMQIGDSFVTTCKDSGRSLILTSKKYAQKYSPQTTFTTAKVGENTIRIWRVN